MSYQEDHYLKKELYELIGRDPSIFEFLQAGSLDGLWYWDLENPENEWMNSTFWKRLGYDSTTKKHLAREWQDIINQDDLKIALDNFNKHCENAGHPYDQVVRYRHKDGHTVWIRCRGMVIRDASGKPIRMLGAHNDLTELKNVEKNLEEKNKLLESLVRHDHLTTLYNRLAFDEHLISQLLISIRQDLPLSLAMIDIDHFKMINDQFGHQKGDEVLCSVAQTLKTHTRSSDMLARYGGEEFAVIMIGSSKMRSIEAGERLRIAVQDNRFDNKCIRVSVGVTTYISTNHRASSDNALGLCAEIINQADKALYAAKINGRNQVQHYDET